MKKILVILALVSIVSLSQLSSCGKGGNSPVDQYVEVLDEATKKAEQINSMSDLMNVQAIISPEEAMNIMRENAAYELTDGDKEKLKKSFDKLLRVAYEKTAEYGGIPESLKEQAKGQVDLMIEAANNGIDQAKTLGDLSGIR